MINIYCDESCHIPNDLSPLMVIGGISCPKDKIRYITKQIFKVKNVMEFLNFLRSNGQKFHLQNCKCIKN